MNHAYTDTQPQYEIFPDSPVREHYGNLMLVVDQVLERDSFDDRPLRSLKNLCIVGAAGEGLKWTIEKFIRFHTEIENHLKKIVACGPMFERDTWAEDKLQAVLEHHNRFTSILTMTPV